MASRTRCRVAGATARGVPRVRDTVAVETPARAATAPIVARPDLLRRLRLTSSTTP
jgi:hypothetical protein